MKILRVFDSLKFVRTMFVAVVVAIFAFAPTHAATLPAGYTELEYLESTGTQYIDTGVNIGENIQTKVKFGKTTNSFSRFGFVIGGGGHYQGLVTRTSTNSYYSSMYSSSQNTIVMSIPDNVFEITFNTQGHKVILNNTASYDLVLLSPYEISNTIGIFRTPGGSSTNNGIGKVYSFVITDNLTNYILFNGIPVRRDSDGVLGMYDLADANPATAFHTNAGTGTFIAGEYKIKIATTKYNEAEFASVQTNLETARTTINNLITQMQTNAINVSKLAVEKQTRPNATCPAGKNCLLVTDPTGAENWYEIAGADAVQSSSNVPDYFSFTTTALNAGDSVSFSLTPSGTFTVDWGDGSTPQVIERTNTTSETYSHSYSNAGAKTIKITGRATGYYSRDQETGVLSFRDESQIASIDGCLGAIFPTLGNASGQQPRFAYTFAYTPITSIPADLFSGITGAADSMFSQTFVGTQITSIPENLFRGVTGAAEQMFNYTFGDTQITSIPAGLFSGITGAADSMFSGTFYGTQITSIPENLFRGVTGAADWMFSGTFESCPNLTGYIPESTFAGLIQNNSPDASDFMSYIFGASTGLATTCPDGTTEVSTPYKSAYWSTGNGNAVMCRPN